MPSEPARPSTSREQLLLLGEEHSAFDHYEVSVLADGRSACVLCAGSSAAQVKDLGPVKNEDALLVIEVGECTLLAVADAHFGPESSHELLERLAGAIDPLPAHPLALLELLPTLADPVESDGHASETTLLIAIVDRSSSSGFGISMGDSSLAVLGLDHPPRIVNSKDGAYARPWVPTSLDPRRANELAFSVRPGELVLAYTDGVDECHYRSPATSVQPHHMEALHIRTGGDPSKFVHELTGLALSGVGGHPGGQDNIAVIATRI